MIRVFFQSLRGKLSALAIVTVIPPSVVAGIVSQRIMQPLRQRTQAIRHKTDDKQRLDIPAKPADESAELARDYQTLVNSLIDSNHRMQAIYNGVADGIVIVDQSGTIISTNPAADCLFGYHQGELEGQHMDMLMPVHFRHQHEGFFRSFNAISYQKMGINRPHGSLDIKGLRADGSLFDMESSVSRIAFGDGYHYIATLRDISMRKAEQERTKALLAEVQQAKKDLERSNASLNDFAYVASHDLKAPMRGIANQSRFLLEDHAESLADDAKKRLKRIETLCAHMENLVSTLLKYSRIGRSATDQSVDPTPIIHDITGSIKELMAEKGASVHIDTALPEIAANPSDIATVFQNLIVNGLLYNNRTEKHIHIGFQEEVFIHDTQWQQLFYVRDNGIGIDPEFHHGIFRMFKRLNQPGAYSEGSGAGLAFVKKVLESNNGHILLDSATGHGSTFYFSFNEPSQFVVYSGQAASER